MVYPTGPSIFPKRTLLFETRKPLSLGGQNPEFQKSLEDERRRRRLLEDEEVGRRGPEAAGEPTEKRAGGGWWWKMFKNVR